MCSMQGGGRGGNHDFPREATSSSQARPAKLGTRVLFRERKTTSQPPPPLTAFSPLNAPNKFQRQPAPPQQPRRNGNFNGGGRYKDWLPPAKLSGMRVRCL